MALTLLRHTRTLSEGVCHGRAEVALASGFVGEAGAVLARLARPDRILSSPLGRCRRLAETIGGRFGLSVDLDPDWREMDFGRWEGRPWDTIPRGEIDAWAGDFLHARPHGGESVAMLLARTRRALDACGEGRTLAVTHKGVMRAALVATGGDPVDWRREIGFGEAIVLGPPSARIG